MEIGRIIPDKEEPGTTFSGLCQARFLVGACNSPDVIWCSYNNLKTRAIARQLSAADVVLAVLGSAADYLSHTESYLVTQCGRSAACRPVEVVLLVAVACAVLHSYNAVLVVSVKARSVVALSSAAFENVVEGIEVSLFTAGLVVNAAHLEAVAVTVDAVAVAVVVSLAVNEGNCAVSSIAVPAVVAVVVSDAVLVIVACARMQLVCEAVSILALSICIVVRMAAVELVV